MFPGIAIDDSRSVNDTSRVIRMTIVSDATTWSITYEHHSDNFRGVIYVCNIFVIQATELYNFFSVTVYSVAQ
jgi:hypothetical protein